MVEKWPLYILKSCVIRIIKDILSFILCIEFVKYQKALLTVLQPAYSLDILPWSNAKFYEASSDKTIAHWF